MRANRINRLVGYDGYSGAAREFGAICPRRLVTFGAGYRKNHSRNDIDAAFRNLPGLVVVSENVANPRTGEVGWIVLPEAAAAAVQGVAT